MNNPAEGNDLPQEESNENATGQAEMSINQEKLNQYLEGLKQEQNLPFGLAAGFGVAIIGAIIWAVVTVSTGYQIGYMALALGFGVGYAVRIAGKGIDQIFGFGGAALALLGCLLGNLFSIIGFVADAQGMGIFETLSVMDFGLIPQIMGETFSPMDLLFYGIAVYEGYHFAFRQVTEEEIIAHAAE